MSFCRVIDFFLKQRSGKSNKVVDLLNRRLILILEMHIEVVGFKELMNLYPKDPNFVEVWKACTIPITFDRMKWLNFIIQDGMLFKGYQLRITRSSMRENLIK